MPLTSSAAADGGLPAFRSTWSLSSPAAEHGVGPALQIKNTFLVYSVTAGELLGDAEREELLAGRGLRRALTWSSLLDAASTGLAESAWPSPKCSKWQTASEDSAATADGGSWPPTPNSACSTADSLEQRPLSEDGEQQDVLRSASGSTTAPAALQAQDPRMQTASPSRRGQLFALDASGLPSVGSAGHETRDCKPCAFLDSRKGCIAGKDCAYCHLCDQGEKKRRQKERRKMYNSTKRAQRSETSE